jgi:catechol 2,3-dioxygenase-like lactoylglutathione lyase family enzyme
MTHAPLAVLETCLYAAELDAAADFYERVLGLEPMSREPGRHVFFRCGAGVFLLFDPARTREATGGVPAHGATGAGHVAFAVPPGGMDAWRERLRGARVPIEKEVEWPTGGSSIYLRDPAGNSVELATPSIWGL